MTTVLDRNELFGAERRAQMDRARATQADFERRVAEGKVRNLGNGRYKITDPGNWDDGEILSMQANGLLLPQHELDTTTGRVAFYGRLPAWHAEGKIVPAGTTDIDEAMEWGGTAFRVAKRPAAFQVDEGGPLVEIPGKYVTYREDTGAPLGIVGERYQIFQNRVGFEFLSDLVEKYDVNWNCVGALRGGAKVFCCMQLPMDIRIDIDGINDEIRPYVIMINTHDGTSPLVAIVSPWRVECGNTERFAVRDALSRWSMRHVGDPLRKAEDARTTLKLSIEYYDQFAREEQVLAESEMAIDEFRNFLTDLWKVPSEDAPVPTQNRWSERRETLTNLFERNAASLGRTKYAAERAITEFADWHSEVRPGGRLRGATDGVVRATAVLEGTRDELKSNAHRRLLERAGR